MFQECTVFENAQYFQYFMYLKYSGVVVKILTSSNRPCLTGVVKTVSLILVFLFFAHLFTSYDCARETTSLVHVLFHESMAVVAYATVVLHRVSKHAKNHFKNL